MTQDEILARIEAFKERLAAYSASYPTESAVLARIRELGIKGKSRNSRDCLIARLLSRELEEPVNVAPAEVILTGFKKDFDDLDLRESLRWVDLPNQLSDIVMSFDRHQYPDWRNDDA